MTATLPPPARKNPLLVTRLPLLPPGARSRTALGLTAAAAEGRFALQVCAECDTVQYPPREACVACLSASLPWREVPAGGRLIAATIVRLSADPYFRQRTPWRVGIVALDCGPSVIAHLHGAVAQDARVRMTLRLDKSGQGVMLAMPDQDSLNMQDDPQLRELTCDPRGCRVLITDGRNAFGQAMARAFAEAGSSSVFVGIADAWKPFLGQAGIVGEPVPLDLTDADSVHRLAASLGGRVDILVNTALHIRPGGVLQRRDTIAAREELEMAVLGPMRLAQAFGPVLRFRGGDDTHPACAWVNLLSAYALAPTPAFGAVAAAQAAALSLAQSLRAELLPVRVVNALVGPLDDEWHQAVPPPKVLPAALATAVVRALRDGIEDLAVGDVAQDLLARWKENPTTLARELAAGSTNRETATMSNLSEFAADLITGRIKVIDLTQTLSSDFPTIALPPEFGQCAPFRLEEISRYDSRGPAWYWNNFSCGEHTGTHFDAPIHWVSGKDFPNNTTDTIPAKNFIAPACVIDCSRESAVNADFILTVAVIEVWEAKHGKIPSGNWVFLRTDWSKKSGAAYANLKADGAHTPGPDPDAVRFLVEQRDVCGFGVETIGTDAGQAHSFTPPYPAHFYMHGKGRYGLQCLANLDQLPPTGALIVSPPLKIKGGSGSPLRVLALVGG